MVLGGRKRPRDTGEPDTPAEKLVYVTAKAVAWENRATAFKEIITTAENATRRAKAAEEQTRKAMEHLKELTREAQHRCVVSEAKAAAERQRHEADARERETADNLLGHAHGVIAANLKASIAEKDDLIAEKDDLIAEKDDLIAEQGDIIAKLRRKRAEAKDKLRWMEARAADKDWWEKMRL